MMIIYVLEAQLDIFSCPCYHPLSSEAVLYEADGSAWKLRLEDLEAALEEWLSQGRMHEISMSSQGKEQQ